MVTATSTSSPTCLSTECHQLVREHLGLVQDVLLKVGRRLPTHVDRDDLYGAGAEALVDAGRRFDAGRGVDFPAFAAKRVRGAMLDELRRWDWAVRSVRTENRRRTVATEALEAELGREPRAAEVAAALGVTVDQLHCTEFASARAKVDSLQDLDAMGVHGLDASAMTPPDVLVEREVHRYLRDALDELPERERHTVAGYFLHERPMRELATELGVTESRVSQLRKRGLALLRESLAPYLLGYGARVASEGRAGTRSVAPARAPGCGSRPAHFTRGTPARATAGTARPATAEYTGPGRDRR
jgi:RNA polymerase sigma factor for flagellar operon FliA